MYTEGFEDLEETEREPRRQYVSGSQQDFDRLYRENERLKKSLEKEKFFNKLLDQEIQELKSNNPNSPQYQSDYWSGNRKVSRGAFYTLLFVTLLMAGYIGYGIYYNKEFNYVGFGKFKSQSIPRVNPTPAEPAADQTTPATNKNEQQSVLNHPAGTNLVEEPTPPAVNDSVPNIIGKADKPAETKPQTKSNKPTADPNDEYNEDEVNAVLNEPVRSVPVRTQPEPSQPQVTEPENRTVIGRYRVTSKANFYNSPDENSMRGTFISESINKTIEALDEKNGFIYVIYTNDLGFTSKGWLSKKDLTKE
jgi:eukaryotic-like serine/threonine-protein kinase